MDFNYEILAEDRGKKYADYFVKTYGEAPVAFMVNTPFDVEEKHYDKNQYDEAIAHRDSYLTKFEEQYSDRDNFDDEFDFLDAPSTGDDETNARLANIANSFAKVFPNRHVDEVATRKFANRIQSDYGVRINGTSS